MSCTRYLKTVAVVALTATRVANAQPPVEPTGKNFHKLVSLDSTEIRQLNSSPDGRWLTAVDAGGIWIMSADGRSKPTRLLSAGYIDRWPTWFPSGDRLAFVSNRASRNGPERLYAMTVAIDPKTGRATAPPRQISTDETPWIGQVSPDGKWVTYPVLAENTWKAVPATGGASRTLLKMENAHSALMYSRDGKTIYFAVGTGNLGQPPHGVWYKVSATGGQPTRAFVNPAAMPYAPDPDRHVVFVPRKADGGRIGRVELYDAKERLVGATDLPEGMQLLFNPGAAGGFYAISAHRRYENSLLTLDGGSTRTLAASQYAWVNGWVDNSTLLIDGKDSGRAFVATLDTAGREGRHVLLPPDARAMGWQGTAGYLTTFWRGPALYVADARTGAIKELAANATSAESDGDRFNVSIPNGQQIELRAITADGRSTPLRRFAKSDSATRLTARGDLVAWAVASNDSITVFSARGVNGRPNKLITVRSQSTVRRNGLNRFELVWSYDGTMLAVTGAAVEPSLAVIRVDEGGAPRGAPVILSPLATQLWSMRWTSDNRTLVLTGVPNGERSEFLMRVPIDPKEAPTLYGRNGEWPHVSPDGKRVAYPAVRTIGTTIWRVDFVPSTKAGSSGKP